MTIHFTTETNYHFKLFLNQLPKPNEMNDTAKQQDKILRIMKRKAEPMTKSMIGNRLLPKWSGPYPAWVSNAVEEMVNKGVIERGGRSYYQLPATKGDVNQGKLF